METLLGHYLHWIIIESEEWLMMPGSHGKKEVRPFPSTFGHFQLWRIYFYIIALLQMTLSGKWCEQITLPLAAAAAATNVVWLLLLRETHLIMLPSHKWISLSLSLWYHKLHECRETDRQWEHACLLRSLYPNPPACQYILSLSLCIFIAN